MYSSENRRTPRAVPWALEELDPSDRFLSLSGDAPCDGASADLAANAALVAEPSRPADEYAQGYADGAHAVRAEFASAVTSALLALADAVEHVRLHEAPWIANAEENLAAMAVVVAQHVIEREVTADTQIVRELVRRALAQFPLDQTISVRLHPDDLTACESLLAPDAIGRQRDIRLLADLHVHRGGCLVEGRERVIDGRVDTSLERAYRSLGQLQA